MRIEYLKKQEISGSLTEAETSEILCEKYLGDYDTLIKKNLYDDTWANALKNYDDIKDIKVQELDNLKQRNL